MPKQKAAKSPLIITIPAGMLSQAELNHAAGLLGGSVGELAAVALSVILDGFEETLDASHCKIAELREQAGMRRRAK